MQVIQVRKERPECPTVKVFLRVFLMVIFVISFNAAQEAEAKRRSTRSKSATPERVTTPAEDFALCEQESRRRISAIESEGKSKYSLIDFSKSEFKEEVAELPHHNALPRRRRGAKPPPTPKPKPPLLGRRLIFQGTVAESDKNQPVNVSCLVHLGRIITLVFELGDQVMGLEKSTGPEQTETPKPATLEKESPP